MELKKRTGTWALRHTIRNLLPPQPRHYRKTDLALKILVVIALYAGGGAALYRYFQSAPDSGSINLAVETKVLPYSDKLRLLAVQVKSINPHPAETALDRKKGDVFKLQFREIPSAMKLGDVIGEDGGKLLQTIEILPKAVSYSVVSRLQRDDMRVIVVPAHSTILVRAEIDRESGTAHKAEHANADFATSYAVVHID